MDELIGKRIGPYTIREKIGEGGMAVVYKGYQESLNRYVAIKVLRGDLARNQQFVTRFRREALAVAKLSHPNILHVYDAGVAYGVYYIVMDYAPGGSLKDLMRRRPLDMGRAISIVAQVAEALDYAHQRGLIHRDVKPSNILLSADGRPLLTDFGIAKALYEQEQLTRTGTAIGTPEYMAPEQVEGHAVDGRTDIYSLGVVLYEMVGGRPPFRADTPMAVVYQHLNETPPPLRRVNPSAPGWLEAILDQALAKNPAARFQRASDFARSLRREQVVEEQTRPLPPRERRSPSPVPLTGPVTRERPAQPRRQGTVGVLLGAIALVLLALVGGGVWLLLNDGPPPDGNGDPSGLVTFVVTPEIVTQVVTSAAVDPGAGATEVVIVPVASATPAPSATPTPSPRPTEPPAAPPPTQTPTPDWDIPALQANVEALRFFEGPKEQPPRDEREYGQRFARAEARYVYYELYLEYEEHDRRIDFALDIVYYYPDGSVFTEFTGNHHIEPDWTTSWHAKGWGWGEPGKWTLGTYRVELYLEGEMIASGTFEIF